MRRSIRFGGSVLIAVSFCICLFGVPDSLPSWSGCVLSAPADDTDALFEGLPVPSIHTQTLLAVLPAELGTISVFHSPATGASRDAKRPPVSAPKPLSTGVIMCGQMRVYNATYRSLIEHVLRPHKASLYIATFALRGFDTVKGWAVEGLNTSAMPNPPTNFTDVAAVYAPFLQGLYVIDRAAAARYQRHVCQPMVRDIAWQWLVNWKAAEMAAGLSEQAIWTDTANCAPLPPQRACSSGLRAPSAASDGPCVYWRRGGNMAERLRVPSGPHDVFIRVRPDNYMVAPLTVTLRPQTSQLSVRMRCGDHVYESVLHSPKEVFLPPFHVREWPRSVSDHVYIGNATIVAQHMRFYRDTVAMLITNKSFEEVRWLSDAALRGLAAMEPAECTTRRADDHYNFLFKTDKENSEKIARREAKARYGVSLVTLVFGVSVLLRDPLTVQHLRGDFRADGHHGGIGQVLFRDKPPPPNVCPAQSPKWMAYTVRRV